MMATFETTRPAPFGAVTVFRAVSALSTLLEGFGEWNSQRATRKALSKLSVHELNDIGLSPADVDAMKQRISLF